MPEPSDDATPPRTQWTFPNEKFENSLTGTFHYDSGSGQVHWSDETYLIHGYRPGDVVPTLELGRAHLLPEVREQAATFWQEVLGHGGPLSTYLSLRDAQGGLRQVLVVGDQLITNEQVSGAWGLLVDLTRSVRIDSRQVADRAVAASAVSRSIIEQAKGIIIGQTGVTADQAYRLISQRSQDTNRKVAAVAQQIVEKASGMASKEAEAQHAARQIIDSF